MDDKNENDLSFGEFYTCCFSMFVRYIIQRLRVDKYTAEDIVSDAFAVMFMKWESLDNYKEIVLTSWMYKALEMKCLEYRRKNADTLETYNDDMLNIRTPYINTEKVENDKYLRYIDEIKKRLSPTDWSVFECIVIRKFSMKETAKMLNISEVAVRVRWCRTKSHISFFIKEILFHV